MSEATATKIVHTPGPWECSYDDENGHVIRMGSALGNSSNYESQHLVEYDHFIEPDEGDGSQFAEAAANARLMAAAPDLLDMARMIVMICDSGNVEHARLAMDDNSPLVGEARAWIAYVAGDGERPTR